MSKIKTRHERHERKHLRVRKKITGTTERPRLCVFRSLNHIYAQVVDDMQGQTLVSASTLDKDLQAKLKKTGNRDAAKQVGMLLAQRAKEKGIETIVFDRGGYLYHGRVKSLAEGAREGGLKF
jgi:large subunit ribosomal protein L18